MGRPKKNSSGQLVALIDEFYLNEAQGDISRLNCSELERYASGKGMTVKAYDLRRDKKAMDRIREIREETGRTGTEAVAASYKTLDVEELIRSCRDADELVSRIMELDKYWKNIYESLENREEMRKAFREEREKEASREKEQAMALGKLLEEREELAVKNRTIVKENTALRRIIDRYLYPTVAEYLLKEEGLSVSPGNNVDPEKMEGFVEGKKPEPLRNAQGGRGRLGGTKSQALIEQMRKAAYENGKQ